MPERRRIRIKGYNNEKVKRYSETVWENDECESHAVSEWDGSQPWSQIPLSPLQEDQIETLENLTLKGRQKQVLDLLKEGVLNQLEIARRLGMSQSNVSRALKGIAKKLLKK